MAPDAFDQSYFPGGAPPQMEPANTGGWSPRQRLLIIGGGAILAITLIFIVFSALSGSTPGETTMRTVLSEQANLLIISENGLENGRSREVLNTAATVRAVTTSSDQQLTTYYIETFGDIKDGVVAPDAALTAELEEALLGNRYDETFNELLEIHTNSSLNALQQLFDETNDEALKQLLSETFDSQQLFVVQQ